MRNHIREQIEYRINSMNRQCFEQGSCIKCGCQTTHLQMADKACAGDCYPEMFKKHLWKHFKGLNQKVLKEFFSIKLYLISIGISMYPYL